MRAMSLMAAAILHLLNYSSADAMSLPDSYNVLSSEYGQCMVFYMVVNKCAGSSLKPETTRHYDEAVEIAREGMEWAGEAAGLSKRAIESRAVISGKLMSSEIDHKCRNISMALLKYGETCKRLMEDPRSRLEQLLTDGD
jgi:hypothetical protein